jgi:hypothetical protein
VESRTSTFRRIGGDAKATILDKTCWSGRSSVSSCRLRACFRKLLLGRENAQESDCALCIQLDAPVGRLQVVLSEVVEVDDVSGWFNHIEVLERLIHLEHFEQRPDRSFRSGAIVVLSND